MVLMTTLMKGSGSGDLLVTAMEENVATTGKDSYLAISGNKRMSLTLSVTRVIRVLSLPCVGVKVSSLSLCGRITCFLAEWRDYSDVFVLGIYRWSCRNDYSR
ncbi:hypothetical protein LR48_Vigan08g116300 [Vigna angularis]|uniref:Uncharacterized protein n=1 Tax=Phaseolus angularis TaxID=3914 RepID=A0A0L9V5L5_PHAAN|nr:hypothetical protein LR48_Vigan08g116300 [Vigna angularis]